MRHPYKIILIAVATLSLATSCIKEKLYHCFSNNTISFAYQGDGNTDILNKKIKSIDLLIYDANQTLVKIIHKSQTDSYFTEQELLLTNGSYKCLAIANVKDRTTIHGADIGSKLSDLKLHQVEQNNMNYDPIYIGEKDITINNTENSCNTITFKNLHIRLKVNVIGLEEVRYNVEDMKLIVYDYPSNYMAKEDYINGFRSFEVTLNPEEDKNIASTDTINILKSKPTLPLSIELLNRDKRVEKIQLLEIIQKVKSVDLLKQEVFIPLDIILKPFGIEIQIQDWIIEDHAPEFN